MKKYFKRIGIIGHPRYSSSFITHEIIFNWLLTNNYDVVVESKISKFIKINKPNTGSISNIGQYCDLAIVIGGDGNMLHAARILSSYDIKVIGINRGNLGFLTDLNPNTALNQLQYVLTGNFTIENRFLLEVEVIKHNSSFHLNTAVNEVILHPKKLAHMINFKVYIDNIFAFYQRSDGLIISTPTGSTGYALSAGGPIISTSLEAIVLIPMFPHTLTARPLVISNNSIICFEYLDKIHKLKISCDGKIVFSICSFDTITIKKSKYYLNLIHPNNYNYFETLNSKLNWSTKFFK
ncbi:NAD kinase [Buchnera aphidicola (Neophyllaphis podocarpi)]|uniref:NAD(+) kinase n=1 Tax=Buchnera aphidicola TaxID=9 RepID=UPI003464E0D7